MVRYLLDTDVVSEVLRSEPDPQVEARLRGCRGDAALPSVVWHELVEAAGRMPPGSRRSQLAAFLLDVVVPSFPVVPYDREAATWHARQRADPSGSATAEASAPGMADGMVAAVAAVHGLVLVTADPSRYSSFPGVSVERWHGRPGRSRG